MSQFGILEIRSPCCITVCKEGKPLEMAKRLMTVKSHKQPSRFKSIRASLRIGDAARVFIIVFELIKKTDNKNANKLGSAQGQIIRETNRANY